MLNHDTVKSIALLSVNATLKSVKVRGSTSYYRFTSPCGTHFSAMIDSDFSVFDAACEIFSSLEFFKRDK